MSWVSEVLVSVAAFVAGMLCLVKAGRNMRTTQSAATIGTSANFVMAFVSSVLALGILAASGARRRELYGILSSTTEVLPWVLAFAVLFFVGNMFFFNGLVNAPNAGYARALMTVEVGALAIMSWLLFGSPLSVQKSVGIVLVVVGAIAVSL